MKSKSQFSPTRRTFVSTHKVQPVQYSQGFKPKLITDFSPLGKVDKFGTALMITLPRQPLLTTEMAVKGKAQSQKVEILRSLEDENISPLEILLRVSQCSTPYANLLKLAYDELQYATAPTHSAQFEELERTSVLTSAKRDVEVQQQQDRMLRLKAEGNNLRKTLQKHQKTLQKLNEDIDRLNNLVSQHSVESADMMAYPQQLQQRDEVRSARTQTVNSTINMQDEIALNEAIPLDEVLYKQLWGEQMLLNQQIDDLEKQLRKIQQKQLVTYHERAEYILNSK